MLLLICWHLLSMLKNKMIELTKYTKQPTNIGIKLRNSISDQITQLPEDPQYSQVRQLINKLNNTNLSLKKYKDQYFKTVNSQKQKNIYKSLNQAITNGTKYMNDLKPGLQKIKNQFNKQAGEGNKSKLIQFTSISQDANSAIFNFKEIQQIITDKIRNNIHRQAQIINKKQLTKQQLQNLMIHPDIGKQMLQQKLLDSPSNQLQNSVSDIIDKCNDVIKLQKNMRQCLRMMEQLAQLVHQQGQKLITIQLAVGAAQDHIQKGDVKLQQGKEHHKKAQKKMCIVMTIVLVIIAIIIFVVVLKAT